jgi:hypothetical protein
MKLLSLALLLLVPLAVSNAEPERRADAERRADLDFDAQDIVNCQAKESDPDNVEICIKWEREMRASLTFLRSYARYHPESDAMWHHWRRHCLNEWPGRVEGYDWYGVQSCIRGRLRQERTRSKYLEREYGHKKVVDGDVTWHIYGLKKYSSTGELCVRESLESEWECR